MQHRTVLIIFPSVLQTITRDGSGSLERGEAQNSQSSIDAT